jgi:hypothetical protein
MRMKIKSIAKGDGKIVKESRFAVMIEMVEEMKEEVKEEDMKMFPLAMYFDKNKSLG